MSGDVTGPASSVSGDIATFAGTTGKVIADSGTQVSQVAKLANNNMFTAIQRIVPTSGDAELDLRAPASGDPAAIRMRTGGDNRWIIEKNADTEGGSNAGSNLQITRYNDAGSTIDSPIVISRATGVVDFEHVPTVDGVALAVDSGLAKLAANNTFTAIQRIIPAGGPSELDLRSPTGQSADILMRSGGNNRWLVGKGGGTESGGNVGSDFQISRYNDAGSLIDTPVTINRASGIVDFEHVPTVDDVKVALNRAGAVYPEDFGATGGPDDTLAVQAFFDYLGANGGLGIMSKWYNCSDTIVLVSSARWTVKGIGPRQCGIKKSASHGGSTVELYCDNFTLDDIGIDANKRQFPDGNHGIKVQDGSGWTIRNIWVYDFVGAGMLLTKAKYECTISNASPMVITLAGHGLSAGAKITLRHDVDVVGSILPSPLVTNRTYYVKTVLSANTFTISATPGGSAINTTSAGVGPYYMLYYVGEAIVEHFHIDGGPVAGGGSGSLAGGANGLSFVDHINSHARHGVVENIHSKTPCIGLQFKGTNFGCTISNCKTRNCFIGCSTQNDDDGFRGSNNVFSNIVCVEPNPYADTNEDGIVILDTSYGLRLGSGDHNSAFGMHFDGNNVDDHVACSVGNSQDRGCTVNFVAHNCGGTDSYVLNMRGPNACVTIEHMADHTAKPIHLDTQCLNSKIFIKRSSDFEIFSPWNLVVDAGATNTTVELFTPGTRFFELADDTVGEININDGTVNGILEVWTNAVNEQFYGWARPFLGSLSIGTGFAGANVATGTTALSNGTGDGVDGKINIAALAGKLQVKNRSGSIRRIGMSFRAVW